MPQLTHGARFNLTNAFAREVHLGAHVFEGADFARAVKTKTHAQDLLFALVQGLEQLLDGGGHHLDGRHVEGRLGRAVLDHVAELGVAVLAQGLGERNRLGTEAQGLNQLVLGHLALVAEFLDGRRAPELELEA